jgi:single-stranded-DNA-specific exonuclease
VSPENEPWNEGVIGLVAGRIAQKFYRPTLVITRSENSYKGSGRSIPELNLSQVIERCSKHLERFGGHPAAVGFSLGIDKLSFFSDSAKTIAASMLKNTDLTPKVIIDAELNFDEITEELIGEVENFSPFGNSNERPTFVTYQATLLDVFNMGASREHVKLKLQDKSERTISALGFGQAEKWQNLNIHEKLDIVYFIEINEFNGQREEQIKIIDIHAPSLPSGLR